MKQKTFELLEVSFKTLRNKHSKILKFKNLNELAEALEGEEVLGSGGNTYLTRRSTAKDFEEGNVQLIHIFSDDDFNSLIYPSFKLQRR